MPLTGFYVDLDDAEVRDALRFSTTVLNAGQFPLELRGGPPPEPQQPTRVAANQCTTWEDVVCGETTPAGHLRVQTQYPVALVLEPCYSFEAATSYELRRLTPQLTPDFTTAGLVRSTGLRGFPFNDEVASDEHDPAPFSTYSVATCGEFARQGLSAGWTQRRTGGDDLGQYITIDDLTGRFALVGYIDPQNLLQETNNADNRAWTALEISGSDVTVLGEGN